MAKTNTRSSFEGCTGAHRPRIAEPWSVLDPWRTPAGSTRKPGTISFAGEWPSLPALLLITTQRFPDKDFLCCFDPREEKYSFTQSLDSIVFMASELRARGLADGDRVIVCGKNSPAWAMAYLAVLFARGVVVPVDAGLHNEEITTLARASGAKFAFADPDKATAMQGVPGFYCLEEKGDNSVYRFIGKRAADHEQIVEGALGVDADSLAAILYTSGTTGTPKGVMLTHTNLVSDSFLGQFHMPIYSSDVFYALLPIHHSYTMLAVFIESVSVGASILFGKRMVTTQILKDLKQGKVTMFLAVPLLFNKVLAGILRGVKEKGKPVYAIIRFLMFVSGRIKKYTGMNPGKKLFHSVLSKASLDTLRICISGGGPLASRTFKLFNQLGLDFVQGYGLTETSPIITLNPTWKYKEQSVGAILPQTSMRILEPDQDGRGEIVVKGPMVMKGYYNNDAATSAIFTPDGWLKTGDVGWIDADGYLYLTGRARNLIVTEGGKNVWPEEIEDAFQLYNEVSQVMVRGYIADKSLKSEGIEVVLYPTEDSFKDKDGVVDWAKAKLRLENIVAEINTKLLPYQRITRVKVLEAAMEETTTKKIRRHMVQ